MKPPAGSRTATLGPREKDTLARAYFVRRCLIGNSPVYPELNVLTPNPPDEHSLLLPHEFRSFFESLAGMPISASIIPLVSAVLHCFYLSSLLSFSFLQAERLGDMGTPRQPRNCRENQTDRKFSPTSDQQDIDHGASVPYARFYCGVKPRVVLGCVIHIAHCNAD